MERKTDTYLVMHGLSLLRSNYMNLCKLNGRSIFILIEMLVQYVLTIFISEKISNEGLSISRCSYLVGVYDYKIREALKTGTNLKLNFSEMLFVCNCFNISICEVYRRVIQDIQIINGVQCLNKKIY